MPDGVRIVIPVRKRWFSLAFLAFWLVIWGLGEGNALGEILHGHSETDGFLLLWLVGWSVGGLSAAAMLIWQLAGETVLEIGPGYFRHRQGIGFLAVGRTYDLNEVRNLRATVADSGASTWPRSTDFWSPGRGVISFAYGERASSIRPGLEPSEANSVVNLLSRYLG